MREIGRGRMVWKSQVGAASSCTYKCIVVTVCRICSDQRCAQTTHSLEILTSAIWLAAAPFNNHIVYMSRWFPLPTPRCGIDPAFII